MYGAAMSLARFGARRVSGGGFRPLLNCRFSTQKASEAEVRRRLERLERNVIYDKLGTEGRSPGGEEAKDFSRIIATNILADLSHQRAKMDNGTRVLIAVVGVIGYKIYLGSREEKLTRDRERLEHEKDILEKDKVQITQEKNKIVEVKSDLADEYKSLAEREKEVWELANRGNKSLQVAESILKKNNLFTEYKNEVNNASNNRDDLSETKSVPKQPNPGGCNV